MAHTQSPPEIPEAETRKTGLFAMLKKNFWGIVTLVVVAVVCLWIVQTYKKPGQMSVVESQAMDMTAMLPPKGAVPVGVATAETESISSSVTYTGTVQAYADDDIYPRITGRIVHMPVYAGDRVKKGQLLVQLDPSESEYSAERDEARFAERSAEHTAGTAKSELNEKKHLLDAAKNAEQAARKSQEEAEANLNYWKAEIERQATLLKAQVVSLDEYQKELAEMKSSQAKYEEAQARVKEAESSRLAAQAALDTAVHHVGHQFSAEKQAEAALKKASIQQQYTKIFAPADGVVTRRVISPGVVVSPGMLLLKIAEVAQVRVQAEVASEDANKIHIGDKVYLKSSQDAGNDFVSTITAVFPAADSTSRTFTVETLVDNTLPGTRRGKQVSSVSQYRFLPGQYVVMRIITDEKEGLVVPTSAIIWREGKAHVWKVGAGTIDPAHTKYTCVMHPEVISDKPGTCPKCGMELVPKETGGKKTVDFVDVEIGLSNPEKTEIVKGLEEGDEVVHAGYAELQPGTPVIATEWGQSGPEKLPTASEVQANRLDSGNNWTYEQMLGDLMVKLALQPPKGGSNSIIVTVTKHGGGTVSGAKVSATTSMPGMNMPGPQLSGSTGGNGEVQLKADFMSGLWELKLNISAPGGSAVDSTVDVEVP